MYVTATGALRCPIGSCGNVMISARKEHVEWRAQQHFAATQGSKTEADEELEVGL